MPCYSVTNQRSQVHGGEQCDKLAAMLVAELPVSFAAARHVYRDCAGCMHQLHLPALPTGTATSSVIDRALALHGAFDSELSGEAHADRISDILDCAAIAALLTACHPPCSAVCFADALASVAADAFAVQCVLHSSSNAVKSGLYTIKAVDTANALAVKQGSVTVSIVVDALYETQCCPVY
jgi:hypothetical protein